MTNMEAWLAELEMEVNPSIPTLIDNPYHQFNQSKTMEASYDEQLAATLSEDFPYPPSTECNTTSSPWDFDCNDLLEQFILLPYISTDDDNHHHHNNNNNHSDKIVKYNLQENKKFKNEEEIKKKAVVNGGSKRKRHPSQVQDHILAERKRRELLSQLFISLSAIVPGLKKVDKTSVLGEAIKYTKQLQEKVKALEEVASKRTAESVVVVKKTRIIVDDNGNNDDDYSSTVDDNCAVIVDYHSSFFNHYDDCNGSSGNGGGSNEEDNLNDSLPEIEIKMLGNTLLLRVYCEHKKGILAKLFEEVDKYDLRITNSSVIPFETMTLDISIVAQMESGFNTNVKDFVRNLRSTLRRPV